MSVESTSSSRMLAGQSRRAYELVRANLRSGWLPRNKPLVESELVKSTGLSRTSVRHALARLAGDGLVERKRHTGTHATHDYYQLPIDDVLPSQPPPGFMYRKLSDNIVPMAPMIRRFLESEDPEVGIIEQIYERVSADGIEPICLRTAYYRSSIIQPESWPVCPNLEFAFQYVFGVPLGDIETVIDAMACDEDTAKLLRIRPGAPLLVREQRLRDENGVVQEYSFSHYPADRVSFPLRNRDGRMTGLLAQPEMTPDLRTGYRVPR